MTASVEERYCLGCGYSLLHLAAPRCPECGREFDVGDEATYAVRPPLGIARWLRRGGVVILALLLLYSAGLAVLYWGWREERPVVLLIESNGSVLYTDIGPRWLPKVVPAFARDWLRRVNVAKLNSDGFTDESIAELARLRELNDLRLYNTIVSAEALTPLAELPKLEYLTFEADALHERALPKLTQFRRLRRVILVNPLVDDKAIAEFEKARPDVGVMITN